MPEHILFLTGHLAEPLLRRVLTELGDAGFRWTVRNLGLQVAGLMTADMILRRLDDPAGADRILVPGRCRGDLEAVARKLGVPVERGPDDLMDLSEYFGRGARRVDLSHHAIEIFAELTEAPRQSVAEIVTAAARLRADGADIIDLGCLPQTPFPHLEEAIAALKQAGHRVSVDSLDPEELRRGARAGADYLLSLTRKTLRLAEEVAATPVLIPTTPGDLADLLAAMEWMERRGKPYLADPVLEPLPFGFTASLLRYHELRRRAPQARLLMGTGNLSELTDADTAGLHALLVGVMTELDIGALLTTQVSPHCRCAVRELDAARRLMYAARAAGSLPKGLSDALLALHERKPFPLSAEQIAALAAGVRDPSYRVQVSAAGIHLYNRQGMHTATDPFEFWPHLRVSDDAAHAFYLGVELARAQIAWLLGKRYVQDEPLRWGCAVDAPAEDLTRHRAPGATLRDRDSS
jgi:dihydropteroate synthase-like protein